MNREIHHRLELRADLDAVEEACCWLKQRLAAHDCGADGFALELLAREALINAVVHGARELPDSPIQLELVVSPTELVLEVEDSGPGFDWERALQHQPPPEAVSGRGLLIYRTYADAVRFEQGGARVSLLRRRRS